MERRGPNCSRIRISGSTLGHLFTSGSCSGRMHARGDRIAGVNIGSQQATQLSGLRPDFDTAIAGRASGGGWGTDLTKVRDAEGNEDVRRVSRPV